jgi:hypothetical protein
MKTTFTILEHWITFKRYLMPERTHKIALPQSILRLSACLHDYINIHNTLQCSDCPMDWRSISGRCRNMYLSSILEQLGITPSALSHVNRSSFPGVKRPINHLELMFI